MTILWQQSCAGQIDVSLVANDLEWLAMRPIFEKSSLKP
jgi:hypothetical protein